MKERRNWKSLCRRLYRKALADCFLVVHEGRDAPFHTRYGKSYAVTAKGRNRVTGIPEEYTSVMVFERDELWRCYFELVKLFFCGTDTIVSVAERAGMPKFEFSSDQEFMLKAEVMALI